MSKKSKKNFSYFAWLVGMITVIVAIFWLFGLREVLPRGSLGDPLDTPQGGAVSSMHNAAPVAVNTSTTEKNHEPTLSIAEIGPTGAVPGTVLGEAVVLPAASAAVPSIVPVGGAGIVAPASVAQPSSSLPREDILVGSFNSSTLSVDLSWQPPSSVAGVTYSLFLPDSLVSTTATAYSYPVSDCDFGQVVSFGLQASDALGHSFAYATATVSIPVD